MTAALAAIVAALCLVVGVAPVAKATAHGDRDPARLAAARSDHDTARLATAHRDRGTARLAARLGAARLTASRVSVAYGGQAAQRMDVIPGPRGRRPGVFLVHGGWWSEGDKRTLTWVATRFAALGYAVFNVNYRLSGTATWPAQRDDLVAAIEHAQRHAARYRFDRSRYAVVGFSAGGHIAASAGVLSGRPPGLRGVVGFSPVTSPRLSFEYGGRGEMERRLRASARALAGCDPAACPGTWWSMEPAEQAGAGDAPALMFHSEHDFVPARQSLTLAGRLPGLDVRVLPGSGHSTQLYRLSGVARAAERWLATTLR